MPVTPEVNPGPTFPPKCTDNYPAGSAALGRCNKMVNKMARAAEKTDFHARVQLQKTEKKSLKDLASQMQKTGDANIVAAKEVKAMATGVWAENRKQALLQFAYKRLGLRTESHVCRTDGADVHIDDDAGDLSFAIQEDALTGKFWLFMKVEGAAELESVTVNLVGPDGDLAQQVELFEQQSGNDFWNVQVDEQFHGDSEIMGNVEKVFTGMNVDNTLEFGVEWIYCTERRPVGSNGQVFPMVETEADNDNGI